MTPAPVASAAPPWRCALELSESREVVAGSPDALTRALAAGADLRIHTDFRHNEHIDVASDSDELVREVSDFPVTYVLDDRWSAGIMTLRQPVELSHGGFGRPSMSFFLYNQDGGQAIARPYLDGGGPEPAPDHSGMPRYHELDAWDQDTTAPSSSFVYDFSTYRFLVRESWREVFANDADGSPVRGDIDALGAAVLEGRRIKVGLTGLFADRPGDARAEVFVEAGPCYYYSAQRLLVVESRPVVLVEPGIPLRYGPRNWDFGWLIVRTDGTAHYRRFDPVTLEASQVEHRLGIRWFAEDHSSVSASGTQS